jgi:F-type H+-transporting ATPase subunit c
MKAMKIITTKSFQRRSEMKRFAKVAVGFSTAITAMLVAMPAFAQTADATAYNDRDKWIAIAAGFGMALAAFGGALGQGKAASTALDGIARNPGAADKLFTPMIIGLALIESLVIYSLLISFLLYGKVH